LTGSNKDVRDYDFSVENLKSRAGVRITSDQPLEKANFWAISTVASVEPYIFLKIEPPKEVHWTLRYDVYTLPSASRGER